MNQNRSMSSRPDESIRMNSLETVDYDLEYMQGTFDPTQFDNLC